MRFELKDFQETAVKKLLKDVRRAKSEAADGELQAIILSSPTGSGKTVTVTALMEIILRGDETSNGDPKAVFLWVSDSPELNEQSRNKLLQASSIFKPNDLQIIDATFDQERFTSGKVYFLNTQKLGKDKSLVVKGDKRTFTIWETIRNTQAAEPTRLFVVIDEAHKGMAENPQARNLANSIVQKFIKGSDGELPPINLIVGMSATPERFLNLLDSRRISRRTEIDAADVRASGLLKDSIIVRIPDEEQPSDWSLLRAATESWKRFSDEWQHYADAQKVDALVKPILVVQVEDGDQKKLTKTDLQTTLETIEAVTGRFNDDEIVHCFQEDSLLEIAGYKIKKAEASKIQDNHNIKIVLFKMSLTTGWDCPRAEVMMSFRTAKDHTLIAQLVGRMVRTPLARRIESSEVLNSVSLYLPYYDKAGLQSVVEKLSKPDPEVNLGIEVKIGSETIELKKDPTKQELFDVLSELPSYTIERITKATKVVRLIKLARQLNLDKIDKDAWDAAKDLVVNTLQTEAERLRKDSSFAAAINEKQEISIRALTFDYGELKMNDGVKETIQATPDNIEELFDWCGKQLGEGLQMEYWRKTSDPNLNDPLKAKIELFLVLQDDKARKNLEEVCGQRLQELFTKHSHEIRKLPTSANEKYRKIRQQAKDPEPFTLIYPDSIQDKKGKTKYKHHLYVDENGEYQAELNEWEQTVLNEEMAKPNFIGWLRNIPRKQWALCATYRKDGEIKGMYPDFFIFRKVGERIVVDMLEPHTTSLADASYKAVGLAEFADKHGEFFGRIELINKVNDSLKRLNMCDEAMREKVKKITSNDQLNYLFDEV